MLPIIDLLGDPTMKRAKRKQSKSVKRPRSNSAAKTKAAKRTKTKPRRIEARSDYAADAGTRIVRVLQQRLQPGHWANADQLQKWLIEDELAKLVHAGYLEKFGEDGVGLTDKGKAHKGPVLEIPEE